MPGPRLKGFIYLAKSDATGLHKVGSTIWPKQRILILATADPTITLIDACPTHDMATTERLLHRRLKPWRVRGEWFNLSSELMSWLRSLLANDPHAATQESFLAAASPLVTCGD